MDRKSNLGLLCVVAMLIPCIIQIAYLTSELAKTRETLNNVMIVLFNVSERVEGLKGWSGGI